MPLYIADIPITPITHEKALDVIERYMQSKETRVVVTPYASFWYWANKDATFKRALKSADLSLPDGVGVVAAIHFLRKKISSLPILKELQLIWYGFVAGIGIITGTVSRNGDVEVVRGVDVVSDLLVRAQDRGYKVFFLGGWETTQKILEQKLVRQYPSLHFSMSIGAKNVREPEAKQELQDAIKKLNAFGPDLVFVAFGPPFQEKWVVENRAYIQTGAIMCVGATFDLLSGQLMRAPRILRRMGLEWVWRLVTQPKRLGRILAAFPYFPLYVAYRKWRYPNIVV